MNSKTVDVKEGIELDIHSVRPSTVVPFMAELYQGMERMHEMTAHFERTHFEETILGDAIWYRLSEEEDAKCYDQAIVSNFHWYSVSVCNFVEIFAHIATKQSALDSNRAESYKKSVCGKALVHRILVSAGEDVS